MLEGLTTMIIYTKLRYMSNIQSKNPANISNYLKALSNPKRMEIFMRIAAGCYMAYSSSRDGEICACIGELSQGLNIGLSTVSHHVKELSRAGLIRVERRGQKVECSVNQKAIGELADYFNALAAGAKHKAQFVFGHPMDTDGVNG
ncbi:MAG: metalloregulator ArsR/SmtB family transcription factor [Candidatus Latescibacterota bacterium]